MRRGGAGGRRGRAEGAGGAGGRSGRLVVGSARGRVRERSDENVLRLEIAVDDFPCVKDGQGLQALAGDLAQPLGGEVFWEVALLNVLVNVVQVVAQQLVHDEERLSIVEDIQQSGKQLALLRRHTTREELEELDLPQVLVEDVLGVLRHLDTHETVLAAPLKVLALHRVAKRA